MVSTARRHRYGLAQVPTGTFRSLTRPSVAYHPSWNDPDELFAILSEEWNKIPDDVVLSHTASMRRRVDELWCVQGGYTKY